MADAIIGFGIGLSGTPKDYTGLVAARERQKQIGELEKKKRRQSELEPIKKSIYADPNLYMPWRLEEIRDKGAEMLIRLNQAKDDEDINALMQEQSNYSNYLKILQNERKSMDELQKQYQKGTLKIGVNPQQFYQAATPEEAYKLVEASGGDYFRDSTNAIGSNPVENIDIEKEIFRPAISSMNPYQSTEFVELIGPDGKKVRKYKQFYDQDEYLRRISTRYDNDRALQQLARYNLQSRFDTSKLSPQEVNQKAKSLFEDDALAWMKREKYVPVSEKGKFQIDLNMGGSGGGGISDIGEVDLTYGNLNDPEKGIQEVKRSRVPGFTTTPFKATTSSSSGVRDYKTGRKINIADFNVESVEYGDIRLIPVYKRNVRLQNGTEYQVAGQIVPDNPGQEFTKDNNVEYRVMAIGIGKDKDDNDVKIYRPADDVSGALYDKLGEKEKPVYDKQYRELKRRAAELNGQRAVSQQPKSTPLKKSPVKVDDEFDQFKRRK